MPELPLCQCSRRPGDDFSIPPCAEPMTQEDLLCDGCRERDEGCVCVELSFELIDGEHVLSTHASLDSAFEMSKVLGKAADMIATLHAPP